MHHTLLIFIAFLGLLVTAWSEADGLFHPLLPGITAEPLLIDLPNCNNVLYRHDCKLIALGYAGDLFLLSDTDNDGAEDKVELFWESAGRITGQIGMDLAPKGSPHGNAVFLAAKGKILMIADQDGDDRAEIVQTLAEGWPPARAGVDVTGLTVNPRDGSVWFGLGVRLYNDAYEIEETGTAQNDLSGERGSILRIAPDFKSREKICTGIRWPIALRFNPLGDLFCTDQEGATWLPNGNPYDELLHIQPGRHYGFPPRHPKHLPNVIDEPSVFDYGPQHQSACGMNFNEPVNGGPVFGPSWWRGDALVVGESRGKLYRTKLVKTEVGYVAHNEIFACLGMLAIDACVSPGGELRVCTHSGDPDWGTGPKGKGQIWRVRYDSSSSTPQPVMAWRSSPEEVRVAFDGTLPAELVFAGTTIHAGPNSRAGDRFETMRPPYEVVKRQVTEGRRAVTVLGAEPKADQLSIRTESISERTSFSIDLTDQSLQASANGVSATWKDRETVTEWFPHVDLTVCRDFMQPSGQHATIFARMESPGTLTLKTQLDLWQMLHPKVQKDAQLDYQYSPETVTVTFASTTGPLSIKWGNKFQTSSRGHVTHDLSLTVTPLKDRWLPIELTLEHAGGTAPQLTAFWSTTEDRRQRAFPTRRFLQPWVTPSEPSSAWVPARPETQGGHWAKGKALFFGQRALCSTCHQHEGQGIHIGPDLSQLPFRDHDSVLRDIREPSANINPDYPTHEVTLTSGETLIAVAIIQTDGNVRLGIGPGTAKIVRKTDIAQSRPLAHSLMPAGLTETLSTEERRDLMTFLLHERPVMRDYASLPRDGMDHAPHPRTRAELDAVLTGAPNPPAPTRDISVVLVAGKKDHGDGEHDYPRWQRVWSHMLAMTDKTEISTAWEWPSRRQWDKADVLVFFKRGNWTPERTAELTQFVSRGGGAVFIHWGCEAGDHADTLADVIGLASNSKQTRYRHGIIDLTFGSKDAHPITRGYEKATFHDESYWKLIGDQTQLHSLATGIEEGDAHPLFWFRESSPSGDHLPGRIFVSILGHYSWTFDDPLFRALLLRGIAWTAHEPVDRFNNVIEAGVEVR
ncbi:MAG: putative heme-binding domain-containing protein [Verrucomicrobiales bacterium]|jgi:putative heme-binding domain-containing protein